MYSATQQRAGSWRASVVHTVHWLQCGAFIGINCCQRMWLQSIAYCPQRSCTSQWASTFLLLQHPHCIPVNQIYPSLEVPAAFKVHTDICSCERKTARWSLKQHVDMIIKDNDMVAISGGAWTTVKKSSAVVQTYLFMFFFLVLWVEAAYGDCSAWTLSSGLIIIGDFPPIISRSTHFHSLTSSHSACNYVHTWEGEAGRNKLTRSTHLFHIYKHSTLWCYISYTHLCINMFQKFKVQLIRVQNIKLAVYSTPWKAIQHLSRQRHRKGRKIYQDVFPALCMTEKLIRNLGLCWWMTFTDHIYCSTDCSQAFSLHLNLHTASDQNLEVGGAGNV